MKKVIITVSKNFQKSHINAGKPTDFIMSITNNSKIHTIRGNYKYWSKKFEAINQGLADLRIRTWSDKAYQSPQKEWFRFDRSDGIGLQQLIIKREQNTLQYYVVHGDIHIIVPIEILAENDGLSLEDFQDWFKGYDENSGPLAIIHFTEFRYKSPIRYKP